MLTESKLKAPNNGIFAVVFCTIMLSIYPLVVHNYGDIATIKSETLIYCTATVFALVLFELISKRAKLSKGTFTSITVIFMLVFVAICAFSCAFSPYSSAVDEQKNTWLMLYGSGRSDGVLFLLLNVIAFMIPALLCGYHRFFAYILSFVITVNAVLSCLQLYGYNPFDLVPGNAYHGKFIQFAGTIGNVDFLSAFLCVAISFVAVSYIISDKCKFNFILLIALSLGIFTELSIDVSSGVIGLLASAFVILPILSSCSSRLCRVIDALIAIIIGAVPSFIIHHDYTQSGDFTVTSYSVGTPVFVMIAVVFALIIARILIYKFNFQYSKKAMLIILYSIETAVIVAGLIIIKYCFADADGMLGEISSALNGTLSDMAGSHRIAIWRYSFEIFKKYPIFGTGVGTFSRAFSDIVLPQYQQTIGKYSLPDAAHNEYLQLLVTTGVLGFAAYMTMLISQMIRALKYVFQNPKIAVCFSASVAFAAQMFFNINIILISPFFYLMLGMTEFEIRKAKRNG